MFLFSFLLLIKAEDECPFKEPNTVSNSVFSMLGESRTFLSKFGFNTSTDFPENIENLLSEGLSPYILGILSAVVPFAVVFIVLLLYFCFGQFFAICCCRPKNQKKVQWKAAIYHVAMGLLLLVSIVFFYLSSGSFNGALDEGQEVLPQFSNSFDTILDRINETVEGAFDIIDNTINETVELFTNLVDAVDNNLGTAVEAAENTANELTSASSNVQDIQSSSKQFDTDFQNIRDKCSDLDQIPQLEEKANEITNNINDIKDKINKIKEAKDDINTISTEIKKSINEVTGEVQSQVDSFKNGDAIKGFVEPLENMNGGISNISDVVDDYIQVVSEYWQTITIAVITLFVVFIGFYMFLYPCSNCFSRSCFCLYSTFSSLWNILFMVPAFIFVLLFLILGDVCDGLEGKIDTMLADSLDGLSLEPVLLCKDRIPIIDGLGLTDSFNITEIIYDLKDELNGKLSPVDQLDVLDQLNDTLNVDIDNDFTASSLQGFSTAEIREQLDTLAANAESMGDECKSAFDTYLDTCKADLEQIDTAFTKIEGNVNAAKGHAKTARDTASELSPLILNSTSQTRDLVNELTDGILDILNDGLDRIDCTLICNFYAPTQNMLCTSFVNSMAYWIISSILFAVGIFCLSVSVCQRRKNMKKVTVEDSDEEDDDSMSLDK